MNIIRERIKLFMANLKYAPQEIFQKRDEIGLENSLNMLSEIIEKDKDTEKRKAAIKYIGLINYNSNSLKKECFEILENVLISDDNPELKSEAANSLSFLGTTDALKPLKWILEQESTNNQVRFSALKAISDIRFQEPEIKLFIKELDTKHQSIRESVIHQLIKLKPENLIKLLLESLKNDDFSEKHKIEVIKLISYLLTPLKAILGKSKSHQIKYPKVLTDLVQYKNILLRIIVSVLKDEFLDSALTILGLISRDVSNELIKYMDNEDFVIKTNAIKLIGKLRISKAVGTLLENLDNIYDEVSKASIESLGEIGKMSAVPELLKILNIEEHHYEYIDIDMKWYILDSIKKIYLINKNAEFDYLYSSLNSKNDILLESIAYLFGELGREEFIIPLIRLLGKRNIDVRKNAVIALGKIGKSNALDSLISVVENENNYWLLKKVAADAVYNVYLKNLCMERQSSESERYFNMRTEKMIDYLKQTEDHCKVKISVIKLLEDFGGKTALNALLTQLNDFHRIVRISSSKAIKKIEKRLEEE